MPAGARLEDYYDAYWDRPAPPPLGDPLAGRRAALLRECLSGVDARRVLEVGCGSGELVAVLARDGIEATGMDVAVRAVERASQAYPACRFLQHSAEDLPWPVEPGSQDVVVAFEVIEHLLRPRRLLRGAHAALAEGGHLALTTPYHGALKNLALVVRGFDRHFDVEGDHIRFFSDRALCRLLAETGFTVRRQVHFGRFWGLWAGVFVWARRV